MLLNFCDNKNKQILYHFDIMHTYIESVKNKTKTTTKRAAKTCKTYKFYHKTKQNKNV